MGMFLVLQDQSLTDNRAGFFSMQESFVHPKNALTQKDIVINILKSNYAWAFHSPSSKTL